jgi:hypothetical protein
MHLSIERSSAFLNCQNEYVDTPMRLARRGASGELPNAGDATLAASEPVKNFRRVGDMVLYPSTSPVLRC